MLDITDDLVESYTDRSTDDNSDVGAFDHHVAQQPGSDGRSH